MSRATVDRETIARYLSRAALDWVHNDCGEDEHDLGHTNWEAWLDDADEMFASGVIVPADTIRAEAWDEGIAAVVQYDEGLMIAEMDRDAMIPDYPTNPYRKAAGA